MPVIALLEAKEELEERQLCAPLSVKSTQPVGAASSGALCLGLRAHSADSALSALLASRKMERDGHVAGAGG